MASNQLNFSSIIHCSTHLRVLSVFLIIVGLIEIIVSLTWFNSFFFGAIAAIILGIVGIVSNNKRVVGCGTVLAMTSIILNIILAVTAAIFYTTLQNTQACVSSSLLNSTGYDLHYYGAGAYSQEAATCEHKYRFAEEPSSSVQNPTTIGSPGSIHCYCYVNIRSFSNCTVYEIPPLFYPNCGAIFGRYAENVNATYGIGVVLIVLSFLFVIISCMEIFCPIYCRGESNHGQENSTMHIQHYEQPINYKSLHQHKSAEEIDTNNIDVHVDSNNVEDP